MSQTDWLTAISIVVTLIGIIITIRSYRSNGSTVTVDQSTVEHDQIIATEESGADRVRRFTLGVALVLCCAALWGIGHVLARKIMVEGFDPYLTMFLRNTIAAIFIMLFVVIIKPFSRADNVLITLNGNSLYMLIGRGMAGIFYMLALQHISATSATTLYKFNSITSFLLVIYLLNKKLPKLTYEVVFVGVVICTFGILLASVGANSIELFTNNPEAIGYFYILLAAVCWSVFSVFSEKDEGSSLSKTDLATRQWYMSKILFLSALPALSIFLIRIPYTDFTRIIQILGNPEFVRSLVALGVLTGIVGIFYFEALKRISPVLVTVVVSLEIIITGLIESVFLSFDVNWHFVVGAILIVLGSYLVGREGDKLRLSKDA